MDEIKLKHIGDEENGIVLQIDRGLGSELDGTTDLQRHVADLSAEAMQQPYAENMLNTISSIAYAAAPTYGKEPREIADILISVVMFAIGVGICVERGDNPEELFLTPEQQAKVEERERLTREMFDGDIKENA